MTVFALVHGAWQGAWCWERLIPELERRGHRAVAMDLPCDDAGAGFDAYAAAVEAAIGDVPGDELVLVGHSLGAATIPVVARRRSVRLLVYLCGVVPATADTAGAADEPPDSDEAAFSVLETDGDGCSVWPAGPCGTDGLYPDLSPADRAWAAARVRRQCYGIWNDFVPHERLDDLPSVSIAARDDVAVLPAWSKWVAQRRLGGLEPIWIDGGHWPMITRPGELADLLLEVAGDQ
jgi:pimeloyl-ACP methyl ester carboxylesterase